MWLLVCNSCFGLCLLFVFFLLWIWVAVGGRVVFVGWLLWVSGCLGLLVVVNSVVYSIFFSVFIL